MDEGQPVNSAGCFEAPRMSAFNIARRGDSNRYRIIVGDRDGYGRSTRRGIPHAKSNGNIPGLVFSCPIHRPARWSSPSRPPSLAARTRCRGRSPFLPLPRFPPIARAPEAALRVPRAEKKSGTGAWGWREMLTNISFR